MMDLSAFLALEHARLHNFAPKPTTLEGHQEEASKTLWLSPDGQVEIGIWECTPGRFSADRTQTAEFCHILSGHVEMRHTDGTVDRLGPGDALMLPRGWKGEWVLLEQTRKIYVIYRG